MAKNGEKEMKRWSRRFWAPPSANHTAEIGMARALGLLGTSAVPMPLCVLFILVATITLCVLLIDLCPVCN